MPTVRTAALAAVAVLLVCTAAFPAIRVNPASPGPVFDGASWETAYHTIAEGLAAAASGQEVWVAQGSYTPAVALKASVSLKGSFKASGADPDTRDVKLYPSVLIGQVTGANSAVIDGFETTASPGVNCTSTTCTISGCVLRLNGGTGIYCENSTSTISGNTFTGPTSGGTGVSIYNASPIVRNNLFAGVNAGVTGQPTNVQIINNRFIGCGGQAINVKGSSPTINNNTIVSCGTGIYCDYAQPTHRIANNIIAWNTYGIDSPNGNPTLSHNNVFGSTSADYVQPAIAHATDISADPGLASVEYGNLHIRNDSVCVNAGDNSAPGLPSTDMDGQGRINGVVDIGADESYGETYPSPYEARVIYVDQAAAAGGDGTSWATAYNTIAAANSDIARDGGAEVRIAQGTYPDSGAEYRMFGRYYGGYANGDTPAQRNPGTKVTRIDSACAITMPPMSSLDGLSINVSITCGSNCTVRRNQVSGIITASSARYASVTANDCIGLTLRGCSYTNAASNIVTNNGIIVDNCYAAVNVTNNTVAAAPTGIAVTVASPSLSNNIVAYCGTGISVGYLGSATLSHNDVWGNGRDYSAGVAHPTDVSADPQFMCFEARNLHLSGGGVCNGGADPLAPGIPDIDVDGQARVRFDLDIGADEFYSTVGPSSARIIYVNCAAAPGGNGATWPTAYQTIKAATDDIGVNGPAQIWVAQGIYREAVRLGSFTQLYGGFYAGGTMSTRAPKSYLTILDRPAGEAVSTQVQMGPACTLDGFAITGGLSPAVTCSGSPDKVSNNIIWGNETGIQVGNGYAYIHANRIIGAIRAGIECLDPAGATITSNMVSRSHTYGINISGKSLPVNITNNTLADNPWIALRCNGAREVTVCNNIFSNNVRAIDSSAGPLPTYTLSHNDMWANGMDYNPADQINHPSDIAVDPSFVNSPISDYHIKNDSACRNAGDNAAASVASTDIDGGDRIFGTLVDIGADEALDYYQATTAGPMYVNCAAAPGGTGRTWSGAIKDFTTAMARAMVNYSSVVYVAAGSYNERISMCAGISVLGGFNSGDTPAQRDSWAKPAVVTWNSTADPVVIGGDNATLDGFTLSGGNSGVRCLSSTTTVSRCTLAGNNYGAYLENRSSHGQAWPKVVSCRISGNQGYGVGCYGVGATVGGNLITGESGGIYVSGETYQGESPAIYSNTIVCGSSATAIASYSSEPVISGNILSGYRGVYASSLMPTLSCNDVWNCTSPYYPAGLAHPSDVSVDPAFVGGGDYHLTGSSPCINAGPTATPPIDFDIDGEGRVAGGRVDIGADEIWPENPTMSDIKKAADGALIRSKGAVITAPFADAFYIEALNQSGGIRVNKAAHGLGRWTLADVRGYLSTNANGERCIEASYAGSYDSGNVEPLYVTNKALGGGAFGWQKAVTEWQYGLRKDATGLSNIGMFVTISGRVIDRGTGWGTIDDGTGEIVRCYIPDLCFRGNWVILSGISTCVKIGTEIRRCLWVYSMDDVQTFD